MAENRHPTDMAGSPTLIQQMTGTTSPFIPEEATITYMNAEVDEHRENDEADLSMDIFEDLGRQAREAQKPIGISYV